MIITNDIINMTIISSRFFSRYSFGFWLLLLSAGIQLVKAQKIPTRQLQTPLTNEESLSHAMYRQRAAHQLQRAVTSTPSETEKPSYLQHRLALHAPEFSKVRPLQSQNIDKPSRENNDNDFINDDNESNESDSDLSSPSLSSSEEDNGPDELPSQVPVPQPETTESDLDIESSSLETYNPWHDSFYDRDDDGTYVFGYSLPNGERRWERSYYTNVRDGDGSRIVEGFYTQPRQFSNGLVYELRCYRAGIYGYQALAVEYLKRPPRVQRDEIPNVDCLQR